MAHFPKLLRDLPSFDGPFDAFKLEAKNCDVLFASYPKGTVIPPHSHDTENVGVITQGELILTLDGRETRYRAGEWYHVRAKATHAARFDVETSEIEFWFHVRPRRVLERLGIAEEMKAKTKFPPEGGFTARLLAAGETEMAVQQIGELISVPGVELLGPLPGDLQSVTTFAAAIPSGAHQPDAARALIKYLQSPEAMAVMKGKGLDPI